MREASRLEDQGIRFACFHEPDRNNELTAIATEPITGETRRYFRRYNLVEDELVSLHSTGPP